MTYLMNDHADVRSSASNDNPPKLYYGVRKCDSLEGPAIFLNWTDCEFFVGSEKYDNVEYQSFDKLLDAASYVTFQQVAAANDRPDVAPLSSPMTPRKRSADQASLPSPSGSPKKKLPKIPTLAPSTISDDTTETHSAYGNHADTSTTYRSHDVARRLKVCKNVHGTASGVAEDCFEERFMGLYRFLARWRLAAKKIADGRDKPTHTSFAKIWKLIDLGVDLGVNPETIYMPEPAPSSYRYGVLNHASFERDIQLLKEYKEIYGTTMLLPGEHCYQGHFKERLWKYINLQRLVIQACKGKTQQ
jgi:hypothetical protein